jgi:hypothetical protein
VKAWLASLGAVAVGLIVTAGAATAMDAVMYSAGIFPHQAQAMGDNLFALATAYRALFAIAGGYATTRLAPSKPMLHAWALAGIGLAAGLAGIAAYFVAGAGRTGPGWYPILVAAEALPCVWIGGQLALHRREIG